MLLFDMYMPNKSIYLSNSYLSAFIYIYESSKKIADNFISLIWKLVKYCPNKKVLNPHLHGRLTI